MIGNDQAATRTSQHAPQVCRIGQSRENMGPAILRPLCDIVVIDEHKYSFLGEKHYFAMIRGCKTGEFLFLTRKNYYREKTTSVPLVYALL